MYFVSRGTCDLRHSRHRATYRVHRAYVDRYRDRFSFQFYDDDSRSVRRRRRDVVQEEGEGGGAASCGSGAVSAAENAEARSSPLDCGTRYGIRDTRNRNAPIGRPSTIDVERTEAEPPLDTRANTLVTKRSRIAHRQRWTMLPPVSIKDVKISVNRHTPAISRTTYLERRLDEQKHVPSRVTSEAQPPR